MRPIKPNTTVIEKAKQSIISQLNEIRLKNNKLTLTYDFTEDLKEQLNSTEILKPIIYMTAPTYLKMLEYVLTCDKEIAWHGTVKRGTGEKAHIFYIKDVYLYPQKIAAATVQVDDDKYTQWSDTQSDEDFNNRRFQGHSHVNMGTTPSRVDEENKQLFLQDLLEDDYYIFLITNKRQEHNFEIFDLKQNIIFEKQDIEFRVYLNEKILLDSINDEIKEFCETPKYTNYPGFSEHPNYNPWWNSNGQCNYYTPAETTTKTETPKKKKKVAKWVVSLGKVSDKDIDRTENYFLIAHPELEGDIRTVVINSQYYRVFIPYTPLAYSDQTDLKREGWSVKKYQIEEDEI